MMAGDGEGATALFEAKVIGAAAKQEARTLARSVVSSSLCKSAVYGHDANWGRFLCALGYSGVNFDPENMELYFESAAGKLLVYKDGAGAAVQRGEGFGNPVAAAGYGNCGYEGGNPQRHGLGVRSDL